MDEIKLPVRVHYGEDKVADGQVLLKIFSRGERVRRSLVVFSIWFVVALMAIAVPLLHFVLVPLFVFVGLVHASFRWGVISGILSGSGTCPACGAGFVIAAKPDRWPFGELCDGCSRQLVVTKLTSS